MGEWLRPFVGVVFVVGLALALRWGLARGGWRFAGLRRRLQAGRLEPLDRLALSPHHSLHLVRVAGRVLLIGLHPGGCTLLESLPAGEFRELEALRGEQA